MDYITIIKHRQKSDKLKNEFIDSLKGLLIETIKDMPLPKRLEYMERLSTMYTIQTSKLEALIKQFEADR